MAADTSATTSGGLPEQDPRVIFAAERTLLAWIRTGLALMGFGFVVARFGLFLRELTIIHPAVATQPASADAALADAGSMSVSLWIGVVLVAVGVMMNLTATAAHVRTMRRLRLGEPIAATPWSAATMLAVLMAGLGVAMTAYLLAMRQAQ